LTDFGSILKNRNLQIRHTNLGSITFDVWQE